MNYIEVRWTVPYTVPYTVWHHKLYEDGHRQDEDSHRQDEDGHRQDVASSTTPDPTVYGCTHQVGLLIYYNMS